MAASSASTSAPATEQVEKETFYPVKWVVEETGRSIPIALQGANGPCALLALLNVQFQRGNLTVPPGSQSVAESLAMNMLASLAMAASPDKLQHFVELLPSLRKGMHVNVRFFSPDAFEHTKEIAAFDCFPDVKLLHGWLVDPQDEELVQAFSDLSYNQIMDEMVRINVGQESAPGQSEMVLTTPVPNDYTDIGEPSKDNTAYVSEGPGMYGIPSNNGPPVEPPATSYSIASAGNGLDLIDVALPPHLQPSAPPATPESEKNEDTENEDKVGTERPTSYRTNNFESTTRENQFSVPIVDEISKLDVSEQQRFSAAPAEPAPLKTSAAGPSCEITSPAIDHPEKGSLLGVVEESTHATVPCEGNAEVPAPIESIRVESMVISPKDDFAGPLPLSGNEIVDEPKNQPSTASGVDSNTAVAPLLPAGNEIVDEPKHQSSPVSEVDKHTAAAALPPCGDEIIDEPKHQPSTASGVDKHTARIWDFFASFPTHLTYHGIAEINTQLAEGETSILFRNSHFYVLRKRKGDLYTLVTDVGFQREPDIAWEILRDINGDSDFYSALFFPSVPGTGAAAAQKTAAAAAAATPAAGASASTAPRKPVAAPAKSSPPRNNATLSSRTQCSQQRRPRPNTRPPPTIPPGRKKYDRTKDDNCVLV